MGIADFVVPQQMEHVDMLFESADRYMRRFYAIAHVFRLVEEILLRHDPSRPKEATENEKRHNVKEAVGKNLVPGYLRTEERRKRRSNGNIEKTPPWPEPIRTVLPFM